VKVGKPRNPFANESMAEILVDTDPIGANLLKNYWADIVHLAEALLCKGRLAEKEALVVLDTKSS
jgi:hypothetical protein